MRIAGIVLTVLGGLMCLSSANLALTQYDLHSSHDLSKFLGGLAVSVLILVAGIRMVRSSGTRRTR